MKRQDKPPATGRDAIAGTEHPQHEMVALCALRPSLVHLIHSDHPGLPDDALISQATANVYRSRYVAQMLRRERGALSKLDEEIVKSIASQDIITDNPDADDQATRTIAERASDGLASFGGSWTFIMSFSVFLGLWMLWNAIRGSAAFDPFPFILLNLILSTLAAVQAPIIMMSQKRQEDRDRARARSDYQVNLKAELEIRLLHEKIDHLIQREWRRLEETHAIEQELFDTASRQPKD
jgi:uncharacterized membrane protein